jgi:hypothetical protein
MEINPLDNSQQNLNLPVENQNNSAKVRQYLSQVNTNLNDTQTLRSLSESSIAKAVEEAPNLMQNNTPWNINTQLHASCLFSPRLDQQAWKEQLIALQQQQANVCGISFSNFKHVFVQDLSTLNPEEANPFLQLPKESLLVVFGNCARKVPLNIPHEVTVIGSNSLINMGDNSWSLDISETHFFPYKDTENKTTDLSEVIVLDGANLIGIHIDSENVTTAITANGKMNNPLVIKNNTITGQGSIIITAANCAIVKNNIIPTNIAIDADGYTTLDSYTQGVYLQKCNTYLGDCSDSISTNTDSTSIEQINELEKNRRLCCKYIGEEPNVELLKNRFSPAANSESWQNDLLWLQENSAEIGGIPTSEFKHVSVVNLDEIDPKEMDTFCRKGPENLFIVYGDAERKQHLPISGGATIIGSEAVITLKDSPFYHKLDIPEAVIAVYSSPITSRLFDYDTIYSDNTWGISSSTDPAKVMTNSAMLIAGNYPLIYLKSSNLIGVGIYTHGSAKAIVVNGNETDSIVIADCIFGTPSENNHNSFIQDCKNIRLERNEFYGTYGKYGPIFHNCKNITFLNKINEFDKSYEWKPHGVGLFSRGTNSIDN